MITTTKQPCGLRFRWLPATLTVLSLLTGSSLVMAEQVIFTINPALSSETISAVDNVKGAWVEQSSGSLSAAISGHYLVTFDPLTNAPTQVAFDGGHGFFTLSTAVSGSPAVGSVPGTAPANVAGKTSDDTEQFAFRNVVWDFNTNSPVAVNSGSIDATQVTYKVLSGTYDTVRPDNLGQSGTFVDGAYHPLSTGTFSLSTDNAGHWTLGMNASVLGTYNNGITHGTIVYGGKLFPTPLSPPRTRPR